MSRRRGSVAGDGGEEAPRGAHSGKGPSRRELRGTGMVTVTREKCRAVFVSVRGPGGVVRSFVESTILETFGARKTCPGWYSFFFPRSFSKRRTLQVCVSFYCHEGAKERLVCGPIGIFQDT